MTEYEHATRHTDALDRLSEGDVLEYPEEYGGGRLTIVAVDRRTYEYGPTKLDATARKEDGSTVDLREHHLASALDLAERIPGGDGR